MSTRIFVVDDDPAMLLILSRFFRGRGYVIDGVSQADLQAALSFQPDAILLDWRLPPPLSGEAFLAELRLSPLRDTPVLFISGYCGLEDRIRVLREGADDFLTKPFELRELEVRIAAVVRRAQKQLPFFENELLKIYPEKRRLLVNGELRSLSLTEWVLLTALLRSPKAHRRAELAAYVWGDGSEIELRVIDRMVVNIRRIIEPNPRKPIFLLTVRGVGYRFERSLF